MGTDIAHRLDQAARELRRRGQRVTHQRMAILRNLLERTDHPTAEKVHRDLRETYPTLALSTVYDALQLLVELGETVEVTPATPERRFDPNVADHGHLVCLECGEIRDFPLAPDAPLPDTDSIAAESGFTPVRRLYQQFGYCSRCRPGRASGGDRAPSAG